jgi:hypothetical protein
MKTTGPTSNPHFENFGTMVPAAVYEVNCILPSQASGFNQHRGARDLFQAVLEGAIQDLRLPKSPIRDAAQRWIAEGFVGDIGFNEACDYLGLDAGAVRKQALGGHVRPERRNYRGSSRRRKLSS